MRHSIPGSGTEVPLVADPTVVGVAPEAAPTPSPSGARGLARFLLRRKSALLGALVFGVITLLAVCAPVLAPYDPLRQDITDILKPPAWLEGGSSTHLLGTDSLGRDTLSRLLYGARNSLLISVAAVLFGGGLGLAIGLVA